MGNIYNLIN